MDDSKLVEDFRAGSRGAFEEIVRRYELAVRWQIRRTISNPQSVDDLAQEVFLELLRVRTQADWSVSSSLRGWLLGLAHHKAVDWVRRNARQTVAWAKIPATAAGHYDSYGSPAEDEDRERRLRALQHCLGLLQAAHREVVEEFYGQAKSTELIAARLGKGSGAVRMMLVRIRQALGKCVRKHLEVAL